MGGYGSGRWRTDDRKLAVEECLALDVRKLARDGLIVRPPASGSLWWTDTRTGERTATATFELERIGDDPFLILDYTVGRDEHREGVRLPIELQTTRPHFGGVRWWFRCPILSYGALCRRRVARLYLAPRVTRFGCRHCHDLTYMSCRESHKYDRRFRGITSSLGLDLTPSQIQRVLERRWEA